MSEQKLVDTSKYSVVDECNMDTVLMAVVFDHLKLLKCVNSH